MKRTWISWTLSVWLSCTAAGLASAQQTLSPEDFRDAYLDVLDELATLPIMTHTFAPAGETDPARRARLAALSEMQANLWSDLNENQQAIVSYSNAEMMNLQVQLQAAGVDWRGMPDIMRNLVPMQHLALLDPATPINFPQNNCISFGGFTALGVAKGLALILRVATTQGCKAAQCGGPASVPPCIFAGIARAEFVLADALLQGAVRCYEESFENEGERRLGVKVSSRASQDSVGIRNDCDLSTGRCARAPGVACSTNAQCGDAFSALDLHGKLQQRLDTDLSTRSTQDSIDGQRSAPEPPSSEKSVRTVVDKTDEIVLPRLQAKMDALNAAVAAQGSMLRDIQLLQTRFTISENLLQRHPEFLPIVLFQTPNKISAPAKKFCSISTSRSCTTDADCPPAVAGESCGPAMPPRTCSVSGAACTDFFDCPIQPKAAETCVPQSKPQTGMLQAASDIVQETIDMGRQDDPRIGNSQINHTRATADIHAGNFKQAYHHLRQSYRRAIRP